MRTYLTPCRLNHIYPNVPDMCEMQRRKGYVNSFFTGMFKDSPILEKCITLYRPHSWKGSSVASQNMFTGNTSRKLVVVVSQQQSLLIDFVLLQVRRIIALLWKSMDTPSIGIWTKEQMSCLALERLTYIEKKKNI